MPAAFYALSFEDTGLVVGFCQLGKRDLSKPGAASALLDQLVHDKLILSLSLSAQANGELPKITLQKNQLSVDEVKVNDVDVDPFTKHPWTFLLDLTDATAKPGDGTVKQLLTDPNKIVAPDYHLFGHPPNPTTNPTDRFRIVMPNGVPSGATFYAIIDGQTDSQSVSVPVQGATPIDFNFTSAQGSYHAVLFASRGVKPVFDILKAE